MYDNGIKLADFEIVVGIPLEVTSGVYLLRLPLPFGLDHINVYVLEDSDGWILVDTGLNTKASLAILDATLTEICKDKPLKSVLVTHSHVDHAGAAGWVCEKWNVPLWMTGPEYQTLEDFGLTQNVEKDVSDVDLKSFYHRGGINADLADRICVSLDSFLALFAPLPKLDWALDQCSELVIGNKIWSLFISDGHTRAHLSLFCEELSVLIGGDQVLGRISSNVSVRPEDWSGNPIGTWIEGLSKLLVLPEDTLVLPSHEQPFFGLKVRLNELISGYIENAEKLLTHCYTDNTAEELMRALYPRELSPFDVHLAYGETLAYINYLLAAKRLEEINPGSDVPLYQRLGL